ncbi:MAG: hypothetical protein JWN03_608 [Nocardia sp.]|uniref:hypothetical protein n=1 Tax=Nocardia sp. TaxID=1821 RepID=UPI002613953B|nr:hypothetical protein [Nocardia sp.]MCU1640333.1 hypothetical protein [Nocardia sp.]
MRLRAAHFSLLLLTLAAALTLTACGGGLTSTPSTTTIAPPDPARPPVDIHWEAYQGFQLPIGAHDGPTRLSTTAAGYSHTPQGAALAAINQNVRLTLAPDGAWPDIAAESLMPGPAKDSWVLARAQISITAPANPAATAHIAGYKINTYTSTRTDLTVYSTLTDNSILATLLTVVWSADDWRFQLPDLTSKTNRNQSPTAFPPDMVKLQAPK